MNRKKDVVDGDSKRRRRKSTHRRISGYEIIRRPAWDVRRDAKRSERSRDRRRRAHLSMGSALSTSDFHLLSLSSSLSFSCTREIPRSWRPDFDGSSHALLIAFLTKDKDSLPRSYVPPRVLDRYSCLSQRFRKIETFLFRPFFAKKPFEVPERRFEVIASKLSVRVVTENERLFLSQ